MELRDDLEKILLGGLADDEREKTLQAMRDEDARQLRRARQSAEQWQSNAEGAGEQAANA